MKSIYWAGVYTKIFVVESTKIFLTSLREVITIEKRIK